MDYEEIPHSSTDYDAACALRHEVMRVPLGMVLRPEDVAGEETQLHFIARDASGDVRGVVIFKPLTATHIKLRQMAVDPALQGQGIGAALVRFAERAVYAKGFRTVETNARHYAQGFYEKLGYHADGAFFEEVGLQTLKMNKILGEN